MMFSIHGLHKQEAESRMPKQSILVPVLKNETGVLMYDYGWDEWNYCSNHASQWSYCGMIPSSQYGLEQP